MTFPSVTRRLRFCNFVHMRFFLSSYRASIIRQISLPTHSFSSSLFQRNPTLNFGLACRLFSSSLSSENVSEALSGNDYLEGLYHSWRDNPQSIDASWRDYFESIQSSNNANALGSSAFPSGNGKDSHAADNAIQDSVCVASILNHLKVQQLVRAYQVRGHHLAELDPLGISQANLSYKTVPELEPSFYGFTENNLDEEFILDRMLPHFRQPGKNTMTLRNIISNLKATYCGKLGIEYTHIPNRDICDWIRSKIEVRAKFSYGRIDKERILDRLIWADSFERFIHSKYPGEKRFGLDGCEALIPGMKALIDNSVDHGVENIIIGMSHRGRLNVLSNVVRKPNESIFCEFNGEVDKDVLGSGDVKYHLGMNFERPTPSGKYVYLSLVANPSHLEAVNPVVQGKTRALQFYMNDKNRDKSLGVLIHGDAAFAGQGVVYESLGLIDLPNFSTGGTIHLIVNNQIGFTTDPRFSRSTPYCTDVAKAFSAPILHVNSDDVENVVFACEFAAAFRKQYKRDVVVDIICYRRHGHNEFDEPSFTQPRMYKAIAKKRRVVDMYVQQLLDQHLFTVEEIESYKSRVWGLLETTYANSKTYNPTSKEWLTSSWNGFKSPKEVASEVYAPKPTGISVDLFTSIGHTTSSVPENFDLHKGLVKILEARRKAIDTKEGIDMPTAESLAFGSLLMEEIHVRLSGQDVERGTFSQRHSVLHDQSTEAQYIPLAHVSSDQAPFMVCNSSLSEYAILGFELGYSLVNPRSLICWEAQFGDFYNNAQCIVDQFIVSGERKWLQRSGLVMLLPHGFDGNGPEHSSGRIERFLQLCDDDPNVFPDYAAQKCRQVQDCNIQVVYPSTPANYFHVLRRQVHRDFRKPLIVFNSKALLRHPLARSSFEEFKSGTFFTRLYPEATPGNLLSAEKIKTVIFCSGQVYYMLLRAREANDIRHTALIRIEQLSPFPYDLVTQQLDTYSHATRLVWVQEEPLNMGMWSYVEPRFHTCLKHSKSHRKEAAYVSGFEVTARPPSSSVATGLKKQHHAEEEVLLSQSLLGKAVKPKREVNGVPIW